MTISKDHPVRVFIQLEGDCNGVFVTNKTSTGFDVVELARGTSNTAFSWHAVANRADEESTEEADGAAAMAAGVQTAAAGVHRVSHYADARLPASAEIRSKMRPVGLRRSPLP